MHIHTYRGQDITSFIPILARLRCAVFSEYPYLYVGDLDYEEKYLHLYSQHPQATLVTLQSLDGEIVGCASALPLQADAHGQDCTSVLQQAGYPVEATFVYGESLLLPQFRGQGWGQVFFDEREKAVRQSKTQQGTDYLWAVFFAIMRQDHDLLGKKPD